MADFLKVDDILNSLDWKENMMAAEFGCGSAIFTTSLAKKLRKGRIYALDIQEERLSALQGKLTQQKISNVFTILCDLEGKNGSTLKDNFLDIVLVPNLLFQVDNKHAIIKEAKRVLKSGGQLLVIEWLDNNPLGLEKVIKPLEVKKMAESLGFSLKKEFGSGDYHYVLLFVKND